jgi:hypothetical protein
MTREARQIAIKISIKVAPLDFLLSFIIFLFKIINSFAQTADTSVKEDYDEVKQ